MNYRSNDHCPCAICGKRYVGCHAKCELYNEWKTDTDQIKARERMNRESYTDHDSQPYWRKHRTDKKNAVGQK